ncbi:MAG: metal ABC transporter permease [Bacilli bacterium]|nr:metal ABC transporter permease [Bacilli bacterium]
MFHYEFMIIAFVVATMLALVFPLLGGPVVYKKLSSSGDALAHSSLAGIAIGLVSGLNPMLISIITCVVSFLIIGVLRRKFGKHAEIGVVVVLSGAIALSGILSGYAKAANFDSYLFGSILLLSYEEVYVVAGLLLVTLLFSIFFYQRQLHCLYSEEEAHISGIKTGWLDLLHSLLFALAVAIGSKAVGALVVSSMVVLPTASALLLRKGYCFTLFASLGYSLLAMLGGIVASYYLDWKPGATSAGIAVSALLITLIVRALVTFFKKKALASRG